MDPPAIVKTFNYNLSNQQPMFSVVEPPVHYRSPSSAQKNSTFQDLSFSSYLKPKDPSQKPQANDTNCTIYDAEISIFDAQKYFSENSDIKKHQQQLEASHDHMRLSSVSSADGYNRNFRTRSFHATPTASSEASWNSQTGLLANPPGLVGVSMRNLSTDKKRNSVARKWIFGRKCCCTGKKSVQVKEAVTSDSEHGGPVNYNLYAKRESHKAKTIPSIPERSSITNDVVMDPNPLRLSPEDDFPATDAPRQQRISASGRPFVDGNGGFSFPILNSSTQSTKPALKLGISTKSIINNPLEDPPRDSLEVFQPIHEIRVANADDDMGSDASSDLFEIESFSTQTTSYPLYRRRDSLDEAPTFNVRRFASANGINLNNNIQFGRSSLDEPPTPSVAATECYAPSEVSIDWSVTTAEGFDKASVSNFSVSASEIGNTAFLRQRLPEESSAASTSIGGGDSGKRKGNGGLLLMSCRQEKSVSVGPQPVKYVAAESQSIFPMHVSGRPPRANKAPMGTDQSARLSLAFAA